MKIKSVLLTTILAAVLCTSGNVFAATYGGGDGTAGNPYQIWTPQQMNDIGANSGDWGKCFKLMADINMSIYTGTQYNIIGNNWDNPFTGTFDGNGQVISNLTITAPTQDYVGLFGVVNSGGQIRNLGVENVNLTGQNNVGGLVGRHSTLTTGCYATGSVTGISYVGGLAGLKASGAIDSCYAICAVNGNSYVGGLVGLVASPGGTMSTCYAVGVVSGNSYVGGLVGENHAGTINACFWDMQTSGQTISVGGTGLTTAAMYNADPYLRFFWDFKGEIANGTMDTWTMLQGGSYPVLAWQLANSPVSNDEMSNAIAVTTVSAVSGTSIGATGLDITRNGYNDFADVWYYFDCGQEGKYTITVQPNGFNSTLGVFDAAQREVTFNDDFFGEKSVVILNASAGRRYYIRVAGYDGQTGNFTMTIALGAIQAIQGDLNYDGMVNLVDFAIFAEHWLVGI